MVLDEIIILKDGTFIADVPSLNDYLEGLGFDIHTLANMYTKEWREKYEVLQEDRNWQERQADHYYCALNDLSTEIDKLADKLATGKGGTKVQYAERFKKLTDYYNQYFFLTKRNYLCYNIFSIERKNKKIFSGQKIIIDIV